jgi:hypothetical protein
LAIVSVAVRFVALYVALTGCNEALRQRNSLCARNGDVKPFQASEALWPNVY